MQAEGRPALPEEQALLAKYAGWGGVKAVFETYHDHAYNPETGEVRPNYEWMLKEQTNRGHWLKHWRPLKHQLRQLLTDEEFQQAAASSLNAHYTRESIIQMMWKTVCRMGFDGGLVLEPGCGTGRFIGLRPMDTTHPIQVIGIEKDAITAAIAKYLYPEQRIIHSGIEKVTMSRHCMDLVIGNVPFHQTGPFDPVYDTECRDWSLHNYVIAKALDRLKPGAICAVITSRHTMDSNADQRRLLANRADLLGAVRLPIEMFAKTAGTETTMDIVFLQKRKDPLLVRGESWLTSEAVRDEDGEPVVRITHSGGKQEKSPIRINEYFIRHPEMVIGERTWASNGYTEDYAVSFEGSSEDMLKAVEVALARLPGNVVERTETDAVPIRDLSLLARTADTSGRTREGSYDCDSEGKVVQWVSGATVVPEWAGTKKEKAARAWIGLRNALQRMLDAEIKGESEEVLQVCRTELNTIYDEYVRDYGWLNRKNSAARHLRDDPDYHLVAGLEEIEENTQNGEATFRKAPIFSRRVMRSQELDQAVLTDINDAISASLALRGRVDLDWMEERLRFAEEPTETLEEMVLNTGRVYEDPRTGEFVMASRYLSGNVVQKLKEAENCENPAQFQANINALKVVQPKALTIDQISFRMSSPWLPDKVIMGFAKRIFDAEVRIARNAAGVVVGCEVNAHQRYKNEITREWAAGGVDGMGILRACLSGKPVTVTKTEKDEKGDKVTRVDQEATCAAQEMAERMEEAFAAWVKSSKSQMSQVVEKAYNETINVMVPPTVEGEYLQSRKAWPGLSEEVELRPYRVQFLARMLQSPFGVAAHNVGGGKTFTLIMLTMKMRQTGMAKKPLIVVHNATVSQFATSFRRAYPTSKVLVPTKEDFSTQGRRRFLARASFGDWDAVILSQSQFALLACKEETCSQYFNRQIDEIRRALERAKQMNVKERSTVRSLQSALLSYEKKLSRMLDRIQQRADQAIFFEDLGVDALLLDECHAYKRFPVVTVFGDIKGVPKDHSLRALNTAIVCDYIQRRRNGQFVFGATGTPITNSMAEAWVMLKLFAPNVLAEASMSQFDQFIHNFTRVEARTEFTWAGTFKRVERLGRFVNGEEMTALIRSGMDVRLGATTIGLQIPDVVGERYAVVPLTNPLKECIRRIVRIGNRYNQMDPALKKLYSWVPIVTMQAGMAAALDPRLLDPSLPDDPNSKVNHAVGMIKSMLDEGEADRRTVIVFMDRFNPMDLSSLQKFEQTTGIGISQPSSSIIDIDANTGAVGGEGTGDGEKEGEGDADPSEDAPIIRRAEFSLPHDIKAKLVALGVPETEIEIANEWPKDKRGDLWEKARRGTVRVIMGSTEIMGVGVNINDRMIGLIQLDPPRSMTPAMKEQREGRGLREGNLFRDRGIYVKQLGAEYSMDAAVMQLLEYKQRFVNQVLACGGGNREFNDPCDEVVLGLQEQIAHLTGDQRVIEKSRLDAEVTKLELERRAWVREQQELKMLVEMHEHDLQRAMKQRVPHLESALKLAEEVCSKKPDEMELKGRLGEAKGRDEVEKLLDAELARLRALVSPSQRHPVRQLIVLNGHPVELSCELNLDQLSNSGTYAFLFPGYTEKPNGVRDENEIAFRGNANSGSGMLLSIAGARSRIKTFVQSALTSVEEHKKALAMLTARQSEEFPKEEELSDKRAKLLTVSRDLEANPSEFFEDQEMAESNRNGGTVPPTNTADGLDIAPGR